MEAYTRVLNSATLYRLGEPAERRLSDGKYDSSGPNVIAFSTQKYVSVKNARLDADLKPANELLVRYLSTVI